MTVAEFLQLPDKPYSDWFGSGSSLKDYREVVAEHGEPSEVLIDGCMLCCIYPDKIVVHGYDGNEYIQSFTFPR